MARLIRPAIIFAGLIALWQIIVWISGAPDYILPGPAKVLTALLEQYDLLAEHAVITFAEIIAGLVIGTILGGGSALVMVMWRPTQRWLMPVLVISQAVPGLFIWAFGRLPPVIDLQKS